MTTALLLGLSACSPIASDRSEPEPPRPIPGTSLPPPLLPRASLLPLFELIPRAEYARLAPPVDGLPVGMSDADFATPSVRTSALDKLDELVAQVSGERGQVLAPVPRDPSDRDRAGTIPFRGNPSDAKRVEAVGEPKLYVPLGGDLTTPGNEVAVIGLSGLPRVRTRIRVGVRPQRLAVHPAGLVFVCNQYSNYVSIIDANRDELLSVDGRSVDIATEFFCADLALVSRQGGEPTGDALFLYVANKARRTVLKYAVSLIRNAFGAVVDVRSTPEQALIEIGDVGESPTRLVHDAASRSLYVTSWRGGLVARIDLTSDRVVGRFDSGAPSTDLVRIGSRVYVPTLMPDRGLLGRGETALSPLTRASAFRITGLDGAQHVAHPGALLDRTRSYNFEDVRSGLWELDASLQDPAPIYYTDDISPESAFASEHKVLAGALPQDIAGSADGRRLYVALGGSDLVQELVVTPGAALRPGRSFATRERPFAVNLDEARSRLHVVSWGGEVLEIFDLAGGAKVAEVDLGYALPRYPATDIERGERYFYDASWSNNGRKTCAHCHYDELVSDGVGFANGATAPTAMHRVKPNHNLLTTDAYFWNGSFANGSYRSVAFAAMTRTNCELIAFGLVEGPSSDPASRIGDPANRFRDGQDAACRPIGLVQGQLPENFDQGGVAAPSIASVIGVQKVVANAEIQAASGLSPDALARVMDIYSAAELRLPPNPFQQAKLAGLLPAQEAAAIDRGFQVFALAGCSACHNPSQPRHPYTLGSDRGQGADWAARFTDAYADDPRLLAQLPGGIPDVMLDAIRTFAPSPDVNVHLDPIDFFTPVCFSDASCLSFDDPLEPGILAAEETRRLELLTRFNLADPQRGFMPGNVRGRVIVNVPSLRGIWTQANYLHHGLARSVREAILAPGHPALAAGEVGYAVDARGAFDSHGATRNLDRDDVEALVRYVESIE